MKSALTFYSVLKMPIQDIVACSKAAESAGFEFISVAESFYRDASVLATTIALNTNKIKLGSSIYPIPTRTPFQIAMSTATLNEVSHGRIGFVGLGAGYRTRIEKYFGIKPEKMIERMGEFVEVIRGLLSGSDSSYHGQFFNFNGFPKLVSERLNVPILVAASGDRMLELAGRVADGVILNSIGTPEYYQHAISLVSNSSKIRENKIPKIAASIILSIAETKEEAIKAARPDVLFYLLYPDLDPVIQKTKFYDRTKTIRELHRQGNLNEASSMVSDEMVEELSICGTPDNCRKKINKLVDYGITMPIIRVSVQHLKENERKDAFLDAVGTLKR